MTNSLKPIKARRPSPISVRLSEPERAQLSSRAGKLPLSTYIKSALFGADASSIRAAPKRVSVNQAELAKLLAWLGRTELAAHLAVMAEATKSGSLVITPPVAAQLNKACSDIATMREALMRAMGKQIDEAPVKKRRISAAEFKVLSQAHERQAARQKKISDEEAYHAFDDAIKACRTQR